MPDRRRTPDIMGALLSSQPASIPAEQYAGEPASHNDGIPESQNTIKTASHNAGIPEQQQDSITLSQHDSVPASPKVKATYYIDETAADALEAMWSDARRRAGRRKATSISRSMLVELMLKSALQDLHDNQDRSWIVRIVQDELARVAVEADKKEQTKA